MNLLRRPHYIEVGSGRDGERRAQSKGMFIEKVNRVEKKSWSQSGKATGGIHCLDAMDAGRRLLDSSCFLEGT